MKWMIAFFALSFIVQGCGSLVHGTKQELQINTVPQGARATIGMQICKTPCTLQVPRTAQDLYVEKGNDKRTFNLERISTLAPRSVGMSSGFFPGRSSISHQEARGRYAP